MGAREDAVLANNALGGATVLRQAELDVHSPFTGTLSFECADPDELVGVQRLLSAERPASLARAGGGRIYVRASGPAEGPRSFPGRAALAVDIADEAGPVTV